MQMIYLLASIQVGPESHAAGDVVECNDEDARLVLAAKFGRPATAEDLAGSRNPLPAAMVRDQISKAVPDGPRPHRKTRG